MNKHGRYNITVIGAGQLGSRYLQGIVKSDLDLDVFVVDPSFESIELCRERIHEVDPNYDFTKFISLPSVADLPENLDLAIVATTANVRWKVLRDLYQVDREIKYLILEKVLFQNESEYALCSSLLEDKNVISWVNCPRRLIPIYDEVRRLVAGDLRRVSVTGGEWGLASNAIHFIDIISFISGTDDVTISSCNILSPSESISKRRNFYETSGLITGTCGAVEFKLASNQGVGGEHSIQIDSEYFSITINETKGEMVFIENNVTSMKNFEMPFQSSITQRLVEDILLYGECGLTSLVSSTKLHLPLIREFNNIFKTDYNLEVCPIT